MSALSILSFHSVCLSLCLKNKQQGLTCYLIFNRFNVRSWLRLKKLPVFQTRGQPDVGAVASTNSVSQSSRRSRAHPSEIAKHKSARFRNSFALVSFLKSFISSDVFQPRKLLKVFILTRLELENSFVLSIEFYKLQYDNFLIEFINFDYFYFSLFCIPPLLTK